MLQTQLKKVASGIAAIGLLGAFSAPATAANTYDLGVVNTTVGVSSIAIAGSFDDIFKFTLSSPKTVIGSLFGNDVVGDLQAQYRVGFGATPLWTSWSALTAVPSDTDTGLFSFSASASLGAGTYWINFKGTAEQAVYSVSLAPVPEPETYAMLFAGLGLMGTIVARRRKNLAS